MNSKLSSQKIIGVPPQTARFTLSEWKLNLETNNRYCLDQQRLADHILVESSRLIDETAESADLNKNETNHQIQQRITDITFRKQESDIIRKDIVLEIEALELYKERIMDAMSFVKSESLHVCKKCATLRDMRVGIDLVADECDREMVQEIKIIEGALSLLQEVLQQSQEQIRRLRSIVYFIDQESESKSNVLKIDNSIVLLNENSLNLSVYHGKTPLANSNITQEEWEKKTIENNMIASKEKNAGIQLRVYVDLLLKQITEDLSNQYHIVNEAFERRIIETKTAKTKLEIHHSEILRQVNEISRTITRLETEIAKKEGYVALVHTRLGFRAQRTALELCRDTVELQLLEELRILNESMVSLQTILNEAHATLRYLLKTQIQLEEDINVKANTLKIDEIDCMTMRQSIVFHSY